MTDTRKSKTTPRKTRQEHGIQSGTSAANRLAAAILEVLAGVHTPTEAAGMLEISLVRYYQLETRAIEGMIAALEPRPKGQQPSLETRLKHLEKQLEQARRETTRQQALVRATQRGMGLKMPTPAPKVPAGKTGRKKRRPTVRALKAARVLRKNIRGQEDAELQQQAVAVSGAEGSPAKDQAALQGSPSCSD